MYILTLTIWRSLCSLFSCLVKSHSGSGQRRGNGFFSFFDTYLQIIIYKSYPVVNIKFLYKVDNFSNRCKFLFFAGKLCLRDLFHTSKNPIISKFLKLSRIFLSLLQGKIEIPSGLCEFTTLKFYSLKPILQEYVKLLLRLIFYESVYTMFHQKSDKRR